MTAVNILASTFSKLDPHILNMIRDFVHGTTEQRVNNIVKEIKEANDIPVCSDKCKYRPRLKNGKYQKRLLLNTQTPYRCECGRAISTCAWDMAVDKCWYCAPEDYWCCYFYHRACVE